MIDWKNVPLSQRNMLVRLKDADASLHEIAGMLGVELVTLHRYLRRHRENVEIITGERTSDDLPQLAEAIDRALAELPPVSTVRSVSTPYTPLTDIDLIDPNTDQGEFVEWLHDMRATHGNISVGHLCDMHAPYQHKAGCEVAYQLYKHVRPHVAAVGSDFGDFAILSPFKPGDPDEEDAVEDVLDDFEMHWNAMIHDVHTASPDTLLFYISGNHERRFLRAVLLSAPKFRKTLLRRFIEIIKCGGRVKWIGDIDFARLGPLIVQHGNRFNIHSAKSSLEDMGGQTSTMAGHHHYLTSWQISGNEYTTKAITSGALCQRIAHYNKGKRQRRRFQLGTAFADIDLRGREVEFNNIEFTEYFDKVHVRFERQDFTAPIQHENGLLTYQQWRELKYAEDRALGKESPVS